VGRVSLSHWGIGLVGGDAPSSEKKIDFGSQNGDFRCILGTIFTVHLFGLNAKGSAFRLVYFASPLKGFPLELGTDVRDQKLK